MDIILAKKRILLNEPHIATASGTTLANFSTDMKAPLRKCKVSLSPVQTGSGSPSPVANVRPITGLTGLTVYHSGNDTSDPDEYPVTWQTQAGTVYGGTVDVVKGVLKVDRVCYSFNGDETFGDYDLGLATQRYSIKLANLGIGVSQASISQSLCSHFELVSAMNYGLGGARLVSGYFQPLDPNGSQWSNADGFEAWLAEKYTAGTPVQLVMPITAQTYSLTPTQIKSIDGVNNIWTGANGNVDIEYWKH